MSEPTITFTGNAEQLLNEHKKIEEAKNKEIAKLKELLAESKKAYKEEQQMLRDVASALDKTRTAQEIYNDQIKKWTHALVQGKLTLEQFNKLKQAEKEKLDAANAALDKAKQAQDRLTLAQRAGNTESQRSIINADSVSNGFAFMAAKALVAVQAVKQLAQEQKRLREEAEGTVASIDDLSRDYAVQAGLLTEDQRKQSVTNIMKVARDNASTPDQAFNTAAQLASSGFQDAEGDTLDSALKIIKTSDMAKSDPKGYIDAAAKYLEASNQQLNSKNLMAIGVSMRGLFNTPVQASDLAEFSTAAPVLNMRGVDWQTGLSMMTELRRTMSGSMAGTAMRNIALKLTRAGAGNDKQANLALEELGLKPDEIDGIGESMPDALNVLRTRINAQPVERRADLMMKIFEGENIAAADTLMNKLPQVKKNLDAMRDPAMFAAGVNFQLQGHNAEVNRAELDKQMDHMEKAEAVSRKSMMLREIKRNEERQYQGQSIPYQLLDNAINAATQMTGGQSLNAFSYEMGWKTEDEALQQSVNGSELFRHMGKPIGWRSEAQKQQAYKNLDKSGQAFTAEEVKQRLDPQMEKQNAILEDIRDNLNKIQPPSMTPASRNPATAGRPDR